ncbi:MAG: hypothetical protein QCH99_11130 [Candidatus Bathyarchaeota archaeon]|nr:hypothetical protein [Candidatus Bathyarchaeum tardum]
MNRSELNNFFRLIQWEIQEYLNFPMLEILVFLAFYSILNQPTVVISHSMSYNNLRFGFNDITFFMTLGVGALVSRSFGASISKGEIKMLLSYPLKRWHVFISKVTALYIVFTCIYGLTFSFQIYLLKLNLFEPLFYISILSIALQLLVMCSVSTLIVMFVKNDIISIFASILFLYGFENIVSSTTLSSFAGRFNTIFGYFGILTHGTIPIGLVKEYTLNEAILALSIPIIISLILLGITLTYFVRLMEVD